MQVRKQQLELDMEQQAGSKSGKEYVKAIYCIYMYIYTMTEDEMTDGMTEDEMVGWHHRLNGHEFG